LRTRQLEQRGRVRPQDVFPLCLDAD
jgi:hypothetical protein